MQFNVPPHWANFINTAMEIECHSPNLAQLIHSEHAHLFRRVRFLGSNKICDQMLFCNKHTNHFMQKFVVFSLWKGVMWVSTIVFYVPLRNVEFQRRRATQEANETIKKLRAEDPTWLYDDEAAPEKTGTDQQKTTTSWMGFWWFWKETVLDKLIVLLID